MSDFQIIRTTEELEALDPDSLLIADGVSAHDPRTSMYWNRFAGLNYLPAVVIATGDQVRAAREAMEQESE